MAIVNQSKPEGKTARATPGPWTAEIDDGSIWVTPPDRSQAVICDLQPQARALVDAVLCLTKALAPARFRDVSPQELARLCTCGTSYREHYDGWDQNRLDCEEARRRAGGRA